MERGVEKERVHVTCVYKMSSVGFCRRDQSSDDVSGYLGSECAVLGYVRLFATLYGSSPGSSVLGILQARTLEWVAMTCTRGAS